MRTTIMEVDLNKFYKNIEEIKKYVGNKKLMPIIKANGYGTYINKNIEVLNNFDILGVAIIDEAIELRELGYKKEIFILNPINEESINDIIKYDITIGLSSIELLKSIIELNQPIKVHLEIETGMNRTGINIKDLNDFINIIKKYPNIIVEGIYTHLSSADNDIDYTNKQLEIFGNAVNKITEYFTIKYIHSSASNGLLNFDDKVSNLVRPGIIMYGYLSCEQTKKKIHLEPICKLKTKITFLKEVDINESISYGRKYITKEKRKIATIPIGYADGLNRLLSNNGEVVINGKKVPIVGTICMDSCMIDVTDIENVKMGDYIYIWDNVNITVEEIAHKCNTINYEILTNVSYRVRREFK